MTPSNGERDPQWEVVEDEFFAKGADLESDLAAIEQCAATANARRFAIDWPAWRRGALVLAGCAAGILIVATAVIRLMHRPAQAATTDPHAGAPVAETPGLHSHTLMPSLPSGQTETLAPSVAGVPARGPVFPKAEPVTVQAAILADPAVAKQQAKEILLPLANERVSQCRSSLQRQQTTQLSGTCEAAIELDATLAKPLLAWAMSELRHGHTKVAETWVRKIMKVDPTLADAYLILGVAEQGSEHVTSARQAYKRYLELSPRGAYASDVRSALESM
jgi:hypothetical protein